MLKIKIYVRSTQEYSRYEIEVDPNLSQEEFEEKHKESDDCYMGDVYETCPYFSENQNSIEVYLGGKNYVESHEEPVLTSENFTDFTLLEGNRLDYVPDLPDEINKANVWYSHDMKHYQTFYWKDIESFDPKKLVVVYGQDQNGLKYFERFEYDNLEANDFHDHGDTGYGFDGPYFIYHPEQEFSE
jgi:hypothetical protein